MAAVSNSIRKLCVLFQQNDTFHFLESATATRKNDTETEAKNKRNNFLKRKEIIYSDFS